ncbi:uncharacterized protein LOC111330191 [Stylophora pistillata]|uniref:Uncharacterized protein n=1 Tax=Stylophora pistillata TaxID=50429 RepID=A0A2B4SAV9_STYPI|nr:uncharacterized protein LOC111330191 [Stylophora pistillata]PFX25585.1 hypothetical protein AWC38_SpisGene9782 [Stylophora pistillata]
MDFSCLTNASNEDISYKMDKNSSGDKESVRNFCSTRIFNEEVSVTNRSAENYHEPLEASRGARIMANESAREMEQLTQRITYLETEINAQEKEIVSLKQTLFERDDEIADLKEKLSQLKQTGQRSQFDFVKQMATMDEKLQEARKDIDELEDGLNFTVKKNKTKSEESQSKLQAFNGKSYFDVQPSWFDTLSNNGGCLIVENFPIKAKDIEAIKNITSPSKPSAEPAKGKDYFDLQPSWFDTLSKNAGCLEVQNVPVKAKHLEAVKNVKSNSKPYTEPVKGSPYSYHRPLYPILACTVPSGSQIPLAYQQINQHSIPQTEQGLLGRTFDKWFGSYY